MTVITTTNILNRTAAVQNVSYSRNGDDLVVIFGYAANMMLDEWRPTTWETMRTLCPEVSVLKFDGDVGILSLREGRWHQPGE